MKRLNPKGFTVIEELVIALLVMAIASVGFYVYTQRDSGDKNEATSSIDTTSKVAEQETTGSEKEGTVPAGWKEFKDAKTGLVLYYPSDWKSDYGNLFEVTKATKYSDVRLADSDHYYSYSDDLGRFVFFNGAGAEAEDSLKPKLLDVEVDGVSEVWKRPVWENGCTTNYILLITNDVYKLKFPTICNDQKALNAQDKELNSVLETIKL